MTRYKKLDNKRRKEDKDREKNRKRRRKRRLDKKINMNKKKRDPRSQDLHRTLHPQAF